MSGFTDEEVKAELKRRADDRDGRGFRELQQNGTECAHCGAPMQFSSSEFPLCDACDND